jgi:hypothetical protein
MNSKCLITLKIEVDTNLMKLNLNLYKK